MKISIITIVYNNANCIADCIQSLQAQNYSNIEHIIIDGSSTDGTQDIIKPFISQLGYYISEKDNGLYNALNKGIKKATGDIIGILHSDDLFFNKNSVQSIVNAFKKTNADLVYAKGQYVLRDNPNIVKRIYPSKPFRNRFLYFGWIPLHTTIFVKKEVFQNYGLYEENFSIASDYEISLRWFTNKEIKKLFLNEWIVKMRLGGKSTSTHLQKKKSKEDLVIIQQYKLLGWFTLLCKIGRKVPQYLLPKIIKY